MKKWILLLLFAPSFSWSAIAFVQSKSCSNSSSSSACAFNSSITAGDFLVVGCLTNRSNANLALTDTLSNSYHIVGSTLTHNNGVGVMGLWYVWNAAGGANTVTCQDTNALGTWIQQSVHEYSGVMNTADPFDVSSSSAPASTYTTTLMVTSSATTTTSNDLMFAMEGFGLNTVTSQNGTLRENFVDNAFMATEDTSLASPQSYQSNFTSLSNSSSWVGIQAAFKATVPPAPSGTLLITP